MSLSPRNAAVLFSVVWLVPSMVCAQTSSLGAKARKQTAESPKPTPSREAPVSVRNEVYDTHSWIVTRAPKPKMYRPGDLLTIIIRERKEWEADADLRSRNDFKLQSILKNFINFTGGGVGAATFQRGQPNVDLTFKHEIRNLSDSSRDDRFTTRLTAKIIDVKPNGLLVIEGRARIAHDDEVTEVTITGTCRKEDVTADNTILSTQLADKDVVIDNEGALHSSATRGWLTKLLDLFKPF